MRSQVRFLPAAPSQRQSRRDCLFSFRDRCGAAPAPPFRVTPPPALSTLRRRCRSHASPARSSGKSSRPPPRACDVVHAFTATGLGIALRGPDEPFSMHRSPARGPSNARHLRRHPVRPPAGGPEGSEAHRGGVPRRRGVRVARGNRALARVGPERNELQARASRAARTGLRRGGPRACAQAQPRLPRRRAAGEARRAAALEGDPRVLERSGTRLRDLHRRLRDRRQGRRRPERLARAARRARRCVRSRSSSSGCSAVTARSTSGSGR